MREEALIDSVKATSAVSKQNASTQQSKQASPNPTTTNNNNTTQNVTKSKNLSELTKAAKASKNPSDNIY
jgi:hypothetical protein